MSQIPADDFGGAGVIRRFCDRKSCGARILVRWPGRGKNSNREYCSNECSKLAENEGESMTTAIEPDTTQAPIVAGTATKKSPKKGAAKKAKAAPAKKAAKAAANGDLTAPAPATVLELLQKSKAGVTLDQLVNKTGWDNRHKITMAISALRTKHGYTIEREDGKYILK